VQFADVHFSYDHNKVLNGLNFCIYKNTITGIAGRSGSGKSTIAALLQKLYCPSSGKIMIDETDIQDMDNAFLRKMILTVSQHTQLFSASVMQNITIGSDEPDIGKVNEIADRLGITEFISLLPAGFSTMVSEQASNLSGGQKQLISIARALYKGPSVLILDEATASLDEESERKILETMEWYRLKGNTIIIIAHRDSALKTCDRILRLDDGQIV
jgi:ATP-binding cassette subfamily B protein